MKENRNVVVEYKNGWFEGNVDFSRYFEINGMARSSNVWEQFLHFIKTGFHQKKLILIINAKNISRPQSIELLGKITPSYNNEKVLLVLSHGWEGIYSFISTTPYSN